MNSSPKVRGKEEGLHGPMSVSVVLLQCAEVRQWFAYFHSAKGLV